MKYYIVYLTNYNKPDNRDKRLGYIDSLADAQSYNDNNVNKGNNFNTLKYAKHSEDEEPQDVPQIIGPFN